MSSLREPSQPFWRSRLSSPSPFPRWAQTDSIPLVRALQPISVRAGRESRQRGVSLRFPLLWLSRLSKETGIAERTELRAGLRALFATKGGLLMHSARSFRRPEGTAKKSFPLHPGHTLFLQMVRGEAARALSLGPGCLLFAFFWPRYVACEILSSPTRDWTHAPCIGSTREVLGCLLLSLPNCISLGKNSNLSILTSLFYTLGITVSSFSSNHRDRWWKTEIRNEWHGPVRDTWQLLPSFLSLSPAPHIPPLQVVTEHRAELPVLSGSSPLPVLHVGVYICQCCSLSAYPLLPAPLCHRSVLYVCVSIPALQVGSSRSFF